MTTSQAATMLDPLSHEPLWQQAARAIERDVAAGKFVDGGRLPPERELLARLSVSRVTLRRALSSLVDRGVLVSSHGRGWFPAAQKRQEFPQTLESFSETAARLGLAPSSTVLRAAQAPASLDEAEQLSIAPGVMVFHLDRIRQLDGVPVARDTSFLPITAGLSLSGIDFSSASLFRVLLDAGWDLARAEVTVEAQPADGEIADHLQIEAGSPILAMRQMIVDEAGRPRVCSVVRYAGSRYRLRTSFPRVGGLGIRAESRAA